MSHDWHIQLATPHDTLAVISLLKQVAQWLKESGIRQWAFLLEGGDDEEIAQAIVDQHTYLVRKGPELIGTFTVAASQTEWDRHIWGEDASENSLYLHRLALRPATMRKGLGADLLTWITQHAASEQKNLRLDCVADNPQLNQFYQRNGFHLLGTTDGHHKWQKSVEPRA
ncbi:GNAT family N-acetyltransferase [Brevibacillus sp. FSL K6-0770]|uniref:GNAT family N-acetyltransferase n=1 Tax=Brevibacillus TaxID=55080 RepID=UPI000ECF50BE|nr:MULTISPECIES: GNAT family N-acetyltransferase [Brevibacillus]MED2253390.1 GNAT family N-acetyltransferase [Brevibacillus parabrevis]HBZ79301.1 GNAT family N-acetyltransferase [Brevibacillus sp.]